MSTLMFLIGMVAAIFISLFGWTKIILTLQSKEKNTKDLTQSALWFLLFIVAALIGWFFLPGGTFVGILTGYVLSFAVCLNANVKIEKTETKEEDGQETKGQ